MRGEYAHDFVVLRDMRRRCRSDLRTRFCEISGKRHGRCPLRVPFDPKVAGLGVAYFQMDLSSVVQEAQEVVTGGDIVELRLLWVVSRIALSSEEPSPGDTGTISCLRTLSSGGKSV